jgi:hypothetical protein
MTQRDPRRDGLWLHLICYLARTTIEVEDEPFVGNALQFQTNTLIDNPQASSLPLNGRRFLDLAE